MHLPASERSSQERRLDSPRTKIARSLPDGWMDGYTLALLDPFSASVSLSATNITLYHYADASRLSSIALFPSLSSSKRYIGQSSRMVRLIHAGIRLYNAGGRGISNDTELRYSL